jgi:hypothetical protein
MKEHDDKGERMFDKAMVNIKPGQSFSLTVPVYMGAITSQKDFDTHYISTKDRVIMKIHDELELFGTAREAAQIIFNEVIFDNAISTSWNGTLRAYHGKGRYELEYLRKDPPDFFEELNKEYKKLGELRAFL